MRVEPTLAGALDLLNLSVIIVLLLQCYYYVVRLIRVLSVVLLLTMSCHRIDTLGYTLCGSPGSIHAEAALTISPSSHLLVSIAE